MESTQFYILAGLSGISIAGCVILFLKVKAIHYLLEQPVVKKMSPQLKLKPIKVDEHEHAPAAKSDSRPGNSANGNRGPRPNFERPEGGERQNRDGQGRHDRGPRPEGNDRGPRPEGNDRGPRPEGGERGPRNDRFSGRDRGPRNERNDRNDRGERNERNERPDRNGQDRNRNRSETFSNTNEGQSRDQSAKEHASEGNAPVSGRPSLNQPAVADHNSAPALAPRRPLPSTVDQEVASKPFTPPETASAEDAADALFMRDDSEIQHGRRNQLKKKPKFEMGEEEVKAATTEESNA